jgi:hypothetical protein
MKNNKGEYMRVIRERIGYVKGTKGDAGEPGPPWAGGQYLLDRVTSLEENVNNYIEYFQAGVDEQVQTVRNDMDQMFSTIGNNLNTLDRSVDERIEIMEGIYIKKDARGTNNGVAELDGNGLIPEYRLPTNVATTGGDILVSFNSLIGKIVESGIFNENEVQIEC